MIDSKRTHWLGLVALFVAACGARTVEKFESNTNWLGGCDTSAECADGLACECGVCTQNCTEMACPAQLACLSECGSGGSCQKACERDEDCESLDSAAQCDDGVCVASGEGLSYSAVNVVFGSTPPVSASETGDSEVTSEAISSETGAFQTSVAPTSSAGTETPGDSGCRVAYVDYEVGETVPGDGCGYQSCVCLESGELGECSGVLLPCGFDGNGPIRSCDEMFPNGDVPSDSVDINEFHIQGPILRLDVGYGGGCARHDFAVCFRPILTAPVFDEQELVLVHDAHGDNCDAYIQETRLFDVTPMGGAYMTETGADGGFITTQYGVYFFGVYTCEERIAGADAAIVQAKSTLDASCETAADCIAPKVGGECYEDCSIAVRGDQVAMLDALTANLQAGVCDMFQAAGCTEKQTCEPNPVACIDGQCTVVLE